MHQILNAKKLAEKTFLLEVEAPEIGKKAKAGQFVIIRIDEKGERIPLTIADSNDKGVTLVILECGKTSAHLSSLKKGDCILDILGPLGNPSEIENFGTVCLVGGGLGIAPIYPIAKALKQNKNKVIVIIGAKTINHLFWEDKLKKVVDELIICTDDGSKGKKGFVTEVLKELIEKTKLDRVIAIGPPIMMKNIANATKGKIKTIVSLNPIMIDGIGMCGGCRVNVAGKIRFACTDGPEFDAHEVDFDEMMRRHKTYIEEERISHKRCHEN